MRRNGRRGATIVTYSDPPVGDGHVEGLDAVTGLRLTRVAVTMENGRAG